MCFFVFRGGEMECGSTYRFGQQPTVFVILFYFICFISGGKGVPTITENNLMFPFSYVLSVCDFMRGECSTNSLNPKP